MDIKVSAGVANRVNVMMRVRQDTVTHNRLFSVVFQRFIFLKGSIYRFKGVG